MVMLVQSMADDNHWPSYFKRCPKSHLCLVRGFLVVLNMPFHLSVCFSAFFPFSFYFSGIISTINNFSSKVVYFFGAHLLHCQHKPWPYRDRAAERRTLHGGFGIGPGQKSSVNDDSSGGALGSDSADAEEAAAEAIEMSFGAGSYARRLLKNMGWKEVGILQACFVINEMILNSNQLGYSSVSV